MRRTFHGRTKDEVARQLREALASVDHGRPVAVGRLTVAQFLDQWLKDKRPTIAASTYDGYEHLLRIHVKPDLGHIKLAKLTPQEVQTWMTRLGERPSRPHRPEGPRLRWT